MDSVSFEKWCRYSVVFCRGAGEFVQCVQYKDEPAFLLTGEGFPDPYPDACCFLNHGYCFVEFDRCDYSWSAGRSC